MSFNIYTEQKYENINLPIQTKQMREKKKKNEIAIKFNASGDRWMRDSIFCCNSSEWGRQRGFKCEKQSSLCNCRLPEMRLDIHYSIFYLKKKIGQKKSHESGA